MVFRPEKQHPTPLRCKKCQKLGHTERYCSDNLKCPNCSTSHDEHTRTSIEHRRLWLSGRFVIRIDKYPEHPLYQNCDNMRRNPKTWKVNNTPSLKLAIGHPTIANIDLFYKLPGYSNQINAPPPWRDTHISTSYFPMTKKPATQNPYAARALFREINHHIPNTITRAYTDGSLNPSTNSTSCAVYIPSLSIQEAYTLTGNSSVYSAEGHGILKAMELTLQHKEISMK
ncbi:hypothetical protein GHT06_008930 [Daphnia sinensis]|uniref:RNase H type-1 domain-containing protein n=1 Tax=Daphnia sinensis TaxID=1820382 RepID=A0AAD5Q367_9CRUS|nr:hypothetical protein GHT06_008930 [Daphnia sinensis]